MIVLRKKDPVENPMLEDDLVLNATPTKKGKPSRQSKRKGHVSRKDHEKSPSGRDPNNPKDIADAVNSNNPADKEWIKEIDN